MGDKKMCTVARYRWGQFKENEQIDCDELDKMTKLDEFVIGSMDVERKHEGTDFFAWDEDIDWDEEGVAVKNAFALVKRK